MKISKQLKKGIQKNFGDLTEQEQITLKLCTILCNEGVSLRNLCDIIGDRAEVDDFDKEMKSLLRSGLLQELGYQIFCPMEVKEVLSSIPLSDETLNPIISRLASKTSLSISDDRLAFREFFQMADGVLAHVLEYPEGIDYIEHTKLVLNMARNYTIYGKIAPTNYKIEDLAIMRSLQLTKKHTENGTLRYATINTNLARLFLNGFHYEKARPLLDEALIIEEQYGDSDERAETFFVYSLFYENYGNLPLCLYYAYQAYNSTDNETIKTYAAMMIAYQLSIVGETAARDCWLSMVHVESIPKYSNLRIISDLIDALKLKDKDAMQTEVILDRTELALIKINPDAALLGRVHYIRSQVLDDWTLAKDANLQYRSYAHLLCRHFASTDGALYILAAAEVIRLTSIGALTAAKQLITKLDKMPLTSPSYALSVQLDVCVSYIIYYRASESPLAETYYEIGLDIVKSQAIPSQETINVIRNIFDGGDVPECVSGDALLWLFEHQHLLNMIANRDCSRSEIQRQIYLLRERFPAHKNELEVVLGSLKDTYDAIHTWHLCIMHAEKEKRYSTSLMCARQAVAEGLTYDALDFYDIALHTRGYKESNRYEQITVLLEAIINMEQCGLRGRTHEYWHQLENMAQYTPLLSDVYQAHGNSEYDAGHFENAIKFYDKCLKVVQPEEGLTDQRLSSLLAYRSSCYGTLGEYQLAYDSAVEAKQYFPLEEFDAFNLEYNHGFFAICIKKYKEARNILTRAKTLARTEEERQSVNEQLSILAMKKEEREAYLKQILHNFDS